MSDVSLRNLIALGEGFTTEFKRTGTSSLGRELCAFANATGGVALIGVTAPSFDISDHWVTTTFRRPEAQGEGWLQPESLELRVFSLLRNGPMAKSMLSAELGQKTISGQLNKVIRLLLANDVTEFTIPEKPGSRLQKYRLTASGKELLGRWEHP